jgi:hypothetical protein
MANRTQVRIARIALFSAVGFMAALLLPVRHRAQAPLATVPAGSTINVSVAVQPPANGGTLSYRWRATDGTVVDVNAPATTWTLPAGQGLQFLYVLVSNSQGGSTEKRLAISTTDPLAISAAVVQGAPAPPIPATPPSGVPLAIHRSWIDDFRPDVSLKMFDLHSGAFSSAVTTDLQGQYVFYGLPFGSYALYVSDAPYLPYRPSTGIFTSGDGPVAITATDATTDYLNWNGDAARLDRSATAVISGRALLADGSTCVVSDPFFGVETTATAELVDGVGAVAVGPVRANTLGVYELDAHLARSGVFRVRVQCAQAPVQEAIVNVARSAPATAVYKGVDVTIPSANPTGVTFSADLNGTPIQTGSGSPPPLPSDAVPAADHFLTMKGLDSRMGACQYYRAIGAVEGCDANGAPVGGINFDAWKKQSGLAPYNTSAESHAIYVNEADLNLTRNHHGLQTANGVAMYVCNYVGPGDDSVQAQVDAAVAGAGANQNLVACVAMDYASQPGVNGGKPYTRFLTFGPSGNLLLSVNLDGRGEKFMPGTCVACHGGDNYAGRYPTDGTGIANVGAHFLPFDTGNFAFSSVSGLQLTDQAAQIQGLNQLVLATNPTHETADLIGGWYASGSTIEDNTYTPPAWTPDGAAHRAVYDDVVKHSCRTCHVALPRYATELNVPFDGLQMVLCGGPSGSHSVPFNHAMPNAKVTFDRMWLTRGAQPPAIDQIARFLAPGAVTVGGAPGLLCEASTPDQIDFPSLAPGTTSYQSCDYSFSPAGPLFFSGEPQTLTVSLVASAPTCAWIAFESGAAMSINGAASFSGQGNATLSLSLPSNPSSAVVSGYLQIKDLASVASTFVGFTQGIAPPPTPPPALRFVPVAPCRVADTRGAAGVFGGPTMTAGSSRTFPIAQSGCNIPSTAEAYSLNVTVVPQGPLSYLTLWPAGQAQPVVSTLNSFGGTVVANAAIVPAGDGGAVNLFVTARTDVILDIDGYFDSPTAPGALSFYPAQPCRVVDTRGAPGPLGGPSIPGRQSRDFPIPSSGCAVPSAASAYSMNVTVVPEGPLGFLTTWPTGEPRPNVSTLNSWTGQVVANAAIVPAGDNGSASVYVSNPTDVVIDVDGYFGLPGGAGALNFYPVTPCRVADTRKDGDLFGGPEIAAVTARSFPIPSSACGIPAAAAAYSVNVTVVPDGPLAYLTAWPTGSPRPVVSTLNSFDGAVVANAAIVPAGTNGAISIFVTNSTHVILDINGYFGP